MNEASVFTHPSRALAGTAADALAARTLQIEVEIWRAVCADFARAPEPDAHPDTAEPLARAARVFARHVPHAQAALWPAGGDRVAATPALCPACGVRRVRVAVVRLPGPTIYGCCEACGHGVCLDGGARAGDADARYGDPTYYDRRDGRGVGYDTYGAEEEYRLAKGARLVAALAGVAASQTGGRPPRSLLEVGSGFGFTREAARRAGLTTGGVDLNPAACAEAARRFGLATFRGDLAGALAAAPASGVRPGTWDAVLYQFVLEHVASVDEELAHARRALGPGGLLALLVPSMEAAERAVFGASYRSLRADHLHLFSRASLGAFLARAGFEIVRFESGCNLHLLRPFLSVDALARLYADGRGPDLWCVARSATP